MLLLFNISYLFSQEEKELKYAIITYVIKSNNKQHPPKEFFWIVPLDSVKSSNDFKTFPLYFDDFSVDELEACQEDKNIDIFRIYSNEKFEFGNAYIDSIKKLKHLINDNRKMFFSVIKKWSNKYKETITVYITPIIGNFCNCNISLESGKQINYTGKIYLPFSNFLYDKTLMKTKSVNDIIFSDLLNYKVTNKK